ncbi:MAG: flagellar hook-length control protein FliK [Kiritimatiellae bacterium]|nr:flagellar hook-length control protein FliK [Kiritimatiellia bacterium]
MTQSLAGIEPVVGHSDDLSLNQSGRTSMADPFEPVPDPAVAEKFKSAMAGGGAFGESAPPEKGVLVWRDVPIAPQNQDGVPIQRHEDVPPDRSAIAPAASHQSDLTPVVPQKDAPLNVGVFGERSSVKGTQVNVGESALPEKGILVGRDVPIAPQHTDGMPIRRHRDVPPYQNIVKPHEMQPDSNELVQVIAPAPLPIELPAAAVRQGPATSVGTPDVVRMFVAAAEAVADAILVSSGFENGEGRILVRLQPEVLGGSEVQITAKGGMLTVVVNPTSQDVQMIVEANRTQFEQHLAEKVHLWRVAVAVRRGDKTNDRV